MYGFFLTLLVLNGIFLAVVILLQAGKGGGLAAMGGGGGTMADGVLGGRQASDFLVKSTWTSGAAFMVLALVLAILSSRGEQPGVLLQQDLQPTAPSPVIPGGEAAPPVEVDPAPPGGGEEGIIPDGL